MTAGFLKDRSESLVALHYVRSTTTVKLHLQVGAIICCNIVEF